MGCGFGDVGVRGIGVLEKYAPGMCTFLWYRLVQFSDADATKRHGFIETEKGRNGSGYKECRMTVHQITTGEVSKLFSLRVKALESSGPIVST